MEAAREAYDAFLSHYPYCYGYWRKYADYEKRKGNKKKCEEVSDPFEVLYRMCVLINHKIKHHLFYAHYIFIITNLLICQFYNFSNSSVGAAQLRI